MLSADSSLTEDECDSLSRICEGSRHGKRAAGARADTEEVALLARCAGRAWSRGEFAFKLGGREIGRLHGDHTAHFGSPKDVWTRLFERGRIDYHPLFPGKPGFGARRIETEDDVRDVIEHMRLNYERVVARHGVTARSAA